MKPKHFFHHMRKRSVAHVVKQCGRTRGYAILLFNEVFFGEAIKHSTHQMKRAQRVSKTRMLRALVSVESESELLDASQSLKFRRVDQTHHQLAFVGVGAKTNDVMNRIAIDSFGHLGIS